MFSKFFPVAAAILFAVTSFYSCVDIPGGPPESAFDMRAQVRFVHVGAGIDTIAIALNGANDTAHSVSSAQWTIVNDSTTIVVTDSAFVTTYPSLYYRRFKVDFSEPLDVVEDGVLMGHLSFGDATSYFDMPAGPRDLFLRGLADLVDTLVVQIADTHHVFHRDTVGLGSSKSDTLIPSRSYTVLSAAAGIPAEAITVDYKNPKLVILTDRKASVFFIHDLQSIITQEENRVRYGWINYQIADERYSDRIFRGTPNVPTDSIAIRFLNASRNAPGIRMTLNGIVGTGPDQRSFSVVNDSLPFLTITAYRKYHEGQYSISLSDAGSATPVDSLPGLSLTSHHRYSFVAVDSASSFRLRRYDDD